MVVLSNRGRGQIGGLVCDLGSFEKVTIRVVFNGIVWIQWAYGFDASVALCGGHFGSAYLIVDGEGVASRCLHRFWLSKIPSLHPRR